MIIPVRCISCSEIISPIFRYFTDEVHRAKMARSNENIPKIKYLTTATLADKDSKTIEGKIMDELKLKMCCRRHMLCHVDIE
jgi:DNA-directed RNA polymerase subunit N (RpoN/RPB10)